VRSYSAAQEISAMALPTTPEEWLALAERTRAAADRTSTQDARATLLKVAAQYERTADYMATLGDGDD
jgi:hypothetical protein